MFSQVGLLTVKCNDVLADIIVIRWHLVLALLEAAVGVKFHRRASPPVEGSRVPLRADLSLVLRFLLLLQLGHLDWRLIVGQLGCIVLKVLAAVVDV